VIEFDGLVCDLDGVVYRGDRVIEGAPQALAALRARGVRIVFCTNNSRSTVRQYVEKFRRLGIPVSAEEILTSGGVTAEVLAERGAVGKTALVVGGDGISEPLAEAGLHVVEPAFDGGVDYVVVGLDVDFTYNAMRSSARAVRNGAALIATNGDATFPAPDGLWPGAGAILASIEAASGGRAEVMGKPHPPTMAAAARRLEGCKRIAALGDRPDTDLAGGVALGWMTILVTSGVTAPEDAASVVPKPDHVLPSIAALAQRDFRG
jgi:4-nitrophenyl phosphatase